MKKSLLTITTVTTLLLISGCSHFSSQNSALPMTFYDYHFASPTGQSIDIAQLPSEIQNADIILIGEWHTHAGVHRFQTDLLNQLSESNPNLALSMEQFTRDNQPIVDQYLANEIGEQTLITKGNAWDNYESDYRPLVELAKSKQLDVIAANAPKAIVQCIGRQGIDYTEKLNQEERSWLANNIDTSDSPYKTTFFSSMHHGDKSQTEKQYAAQLTWDATMAESMVNYLKKNPEKQIMHIAGKFHIDNGEGTAAQIKQLNPNLNIVIISPIDEIKNDSQDYQLEILSPPTRFVKKENRMAAYKKLKGRNKGLECQ